MSTSNVQSTVDATNAVVNLRGSKVVHKNTVVTQGGCDECFSFCSYIQCDIPP